MEQPKFVTLHGMRFCRDEKAGYYRNGTHQKLAHRYVWEQAVGPIPAGHDIHHVDRDRGNNDIANLLCLSAEDHKQLHIDEDGTFELRAQRAAWFKRSVMPKAKDWHQSEAGRAWHREHARLSLAKAREHVDRKCEQCGANFRNIKRARFCTPKCKAKWRREAGLDNETRICGHCGVEFTASRYARVRYCGKSCSNTAEPRLPSLRER